MEIFINNPVLSTNIFIVIFAVALLLTIRPKASQEFFSSSVSQELKGLATLMILFGHIGYFLVSDHRFLFPLSVSAGVGVNLFLFLSGYGLSSSALSKPLSIFQFYKKRLAKLFIPMWIVLAVFLLLDYFILSRTYSWTYIWHSVLGWFPVADLASDLNSPLWYFTFILFYYLIFPLVFSKKYYWLTAIIIYFVSYYLLRYNTESSVDVLKLYKVHLLAFPLGVFVAGLYFNRNRWLSIIKNIKTILNHQTFTKKLIYYAIFLLLLFTVAYSAYHSNVGDKPIREQLTSLLTLLAALMIFLIKKFDWKLFSVFGLYSYEIYLLHWPVLYRYDMLYKYLPAWLATVLYLGVFIGLAWVLKKVSNLFLAKKY